MDKPVHHLQRIDISGSKLWLLYFERILYSFDLNSGEIQREHPPFISAVDDFFLLPGGRVLVAMERGDIWVNTAENWEFLTDIPFAGLDKSATLTPAPRLNRPGFGTVPGKERTYRMMIQDDEIVVLSPFNLYRFSLDSGEWMTRPLGEWLFDALQISIAPGPEHSVYAGFNRGELPGGIKLIAGDTGRVVTVDGRQPVTGIEPDPCRKGTLVASAGCCHRSLDFGGLFHISGERMEPFYLDSAIFDIRLSGHSLLAPGKNSLFTYDGTMILSRPLSGFSEIKGLVCSDLSKQLVLVCTDINAKVSDRDYTPLLAVRRN